MNNEITVKFQLIHVILRKHESFGVLKKKMFNFKL